MERSLSVQTEDIKVWSDLVTTGLANATRDMSKMIGQEVRSNSPKLKKTFAQDIPDILGGHQAPAIGVYSTFSGVASGHLMLAHQPELTYMFTDVMGSNAPGTAQSLANVEIFPLG